MAYLKGGSVVDGNLYVEGGLIVRNITTSSGAGGQLPTIDDECAKGSYLVKFDNDQGALKYTALQESLNDNISTILNDKATFTLKLDGLTKGGVEALTTKFDGNRISLDINSYPINISVNTPYVYMVIKGSKIKVSDLFIESMPVDLLPENAPTEFCY